LDGHALAFVGYFLISVSTLKCSWLLCNDNTMTIVWLRHFSYNDANAMIYDLNRTKVGIKKLYFIIASRISLLLDGTHPHLAFFTTVAWITTTWHAIYGTPNIIMKSGCMYLRNTFYSGL
jgi:hypothetical protein